MATAAVPAQATNHGPSLMANTALGAAFPDKYALKDSKEGSKTALTHWSIISRKAKDTAISVLKTLHANKLAAVPVYDADAKKWIGFIDDQDYLQYALTAFFKESGISKDDNPARLFTEEELKVMTEKLTKLPNFVENIISKSGTTVADVASLTGRGAWHPLKWSDSVATAFEVFATHRVRRIPIIEETTGQLVTILSRTDLTQWYFENTNHFSELKVTPLQNLPGVKKEVFALPLNAHGFDAFWLMNQKGVSAVGVLDTEGKVCAAVKMTDVKRVDGNIGPRLPLTLAEYSQAQEKKKFYIMSRVGLFGGAVHMLQQGAARRIFVFEPENNHPFGVLSQLDVIEQVHRYRKAVLEKAAAATAAQ